MEEGIIQVYYGNGQGKTSAALGNAIKCASHGGTVMMIQFLKGQLSMDFLDRLEPEIRIFRFERSDVSFDELSPEEKQEEKQNFMNGLNFARKALTTGECDMLVLDEVLGVVDEGMATAEDIVNLLKCKSMFTSVILTGKNVHPAIVEAADSVLNIVPEK